MYKFIQNLFDKLWKENIVAQFILDPYNLDMFFKCATNVCKIGYLLNIFTTIASHIKITPIH